MVHKDKVLLVKNERNVWELPGGRMESGEVPEETVVREIYEELGLNCSVEKIINAYDFEVVAYRHVFIVAYHCKVLGNLSIQLSDEHMECGWFSKKDLDVLDLAQGYKDSILKVINKSLH
ncbi:NUDIX hydrolase [Chengkuizengella axinellae]|uniref:NUDIX hydrolase n=1 Tax=Chengkuizengella axinellae TaxID=3064388 RepID=A0ABT9IU37_9BACL|nr:NUDIX hydrolase [Chengkuizengella sp. 2205SS18-9]MDP5272874.1 NUDIX hydrolase [Chengkuizengella sp. 2205SS18-9]